MNIKEGHPLMLKLGQDFLHRCLVEQKSLLSDEVIWTQENFQELKSRYTDNPLTSNQPFDTKIITQLQDASHGARLLFGELYILDLLVLRNVNPATKISKVEAITKLCNPPVSITDEVKKAINVGGVLNGGTGYNTSRYKQFWDLIDFGLLFSSLSEEERRAVAVDPLKLSAHIFRESGERKNRDMQVRRAISFLFMPKHYVPITSGIHLKKILKRYGGLLSTEERSLPSERQASVALKYVQKEKGKGWFFYDDRAEWDLTKPAVSSPEASPVENSVVAEADTVQELADTLLVDAQWLNNLFEILKAKRQVILYGPPGTGKTYLARKIAEDLVDHKDKLSFVQFHPSYSYEDFFEGFRPLSSADGGVQLKLRPGPLRRLADEAARNPEENFFLIIDEINRGNLSKIFGELYFLLEYRDDPVELMYSGDQFTLPKNLFIIGTMNSSDRSIALVDSAMRRRFAFIELHPDVEPARDVLQRWCEGESIPDYVVDIWKALNRSIGTFGNHRDHMIGPSYFMKEAVGTPEGLDQLWATEILPLLDEMFYGQHEFVRKNFSLSVIKEETQMNAGQ